MTIISSLPYFKDTTNIFLLIYSGTSQKKTQNEDVYIKYGKPLILSFTHCCNSSVTEYIINTNINNFPIVSDMTSLTLNNFLFLWTDNDIHIFLSLSSIDCLLVVKIFFSIIIFCCYYLERDQERRGISYNCMMIIILASIDDATSHMMEKIGISLRNQTFLFSSSLY